MIFFTLAQNFAKNRGHCNIHGGHCSVLADIAVSTADTARILHTGRALPTFFTAHALNLCIGFALGNSGTD